MGYVVRPVLCGNSLHGKTGSKQLGMLKSELAGNGSFVPKPDKMRLVINCLITNVKN